jgi:hypothetical protein
VITHAVSVAVTRLGERTLDPSFEPFHRRVRSFHAGPVLRLLSAWSTKTVGARIVIREGDPGADRELNVFESALALAAIFPSEPSAKDVLRLERGLRWARRVFPVLGSLEIYTE